MEKDGLSNQYYTYLKKMMENAVVFGEMFYLFMENFSKLESFIFRQKN
jgi:hypothetical protein